MPHTRAPKVRLISLSSLPVTPPRDHDPRAIHLIQQEILGKIRVALTRLPTSDVVRGFYKRVSGQITHFTELEDGAVDAVLAYIRGGARPPVEVYWSTLAPNGGAYVCSDAEAVLEAYKRLNIGMVPARILRPKNVRSGEGSIWIEPQLSGVGIAKLVSSRPQQSFQSRGMSDDSPVKILGSLSSWSSDVSELVCKFHVNHPSNLNYHHVLNAVARRHARFLDSIKLMIDLGRLEHAAVISRSCYEAYLNFYLDWLAPEFIGPRLQLLSAVRIADYHGDELKILVNFIQLFKKTIDKARLSSLGEKFYTILYPALSRIVHQSYAYIEREGSDFSDVPDEVDSTETIVRCLNVITVALLSRIMNDIGESI